MRGLLLALALAAGCSSVNFRTDTSTARTIKQVEPDALVALHAWVTVEETTTKRHVREQRSFSGERTDTPDGEDVRRTETLWLCSRTDGARAPVCHQADWIGLVRARPRAPAAAPKAGSVTGGAGLEIKVK